MPKRLRLPNGEVVTLENDFDTDRVYALRENGLNEQETFCNDNWLNDGYSSRYSPERNIKGYLSECASYLLSGAAEGTLSPYKERAIRQRECPISSQPDGPRDWPCDSESVDHWERRDTDMCSLTMPEAHDAPKTKKCRQKKKKWPLTRFQKISRLKDQYGDCEFLFIGIDTENRFEVNGVSFWLDEGVAEYKPVNTSNGPYYAMDQVVALINPSTMEIMCFCNQDMEEIPGDLVRRDHEDQTEAIGNKPDALVHNANEAAETNVPQIDMSLGAARHRANHRPANQNQSHAPVGAIRQGASHLIRMFQNSAGNPNCKPPLLRKASALHSMVLSGFSGEPP